MAFAAHAAEFPVSRYGARPDGKTVNTSFIQAAIDAAAAARGTVVFEPGVYLTGALFVRLGVELRVDSGVELRGVQDLAAYPIMPTRVAGIEMSWPAALINVYEQLGQVLDDAARGVRTEGTALGRRLRLPAASADSGI